MMLSLRCLFLLAIAGAFPMMPVAAAAAGDDPPAAAEAAAGADGADGADGAEEPVEETRGPATGDDWIDARFADLDRYAGRHRATFVDELVRYRDAPRELAETLLAEAGWSAGDLYFACALAQVVGRPCRAVVDARQEEPAATWSALAERLGAAPGSAPFRRLKQGYVASYRRWARPLEPDAELRRTAAGEKAAEG